MTTAATKPTHTAAPWEIFQRESSGEIVQLDILQSSTERRLASVNIRPDVPFEANASLIAAAPDLLAAANLLFEFVEKHKAALIGNECTSREYEAALEPAIEAIRKAEVSA